MLPALDRGAATTTVPGPGLVYVYSSQSGVTRLMHVEAPDGAEAVAIGGADVHPESVAASVTTAPRATLPRARRSIVGMVAMLSN